MLTGLDHVIIAVRDLANASRQFGNAMGLIVQPGGKHPGWGTHNAIVRFGLDYIELISIHDPVQAMTNPFGKALAQALDQGEGLLGFALGSDDLRADRSEIVARGIPLEGPLAGSRERPDGTVMRWEMAGLGSDPWGTTLPFLIQHHAPVAEREGWAPVGGHPLAAIRIGALSMAVADLEASSARYRQLLGGPAIVEEVPALPARRAAFRIGEFRLELLMPLAQSGGLYDFAMARKEGLFMVTLQVPDIDRAVAVIGQRGTAVGHPTHRRRAPLLDHQQTLGVRFQLVEKVW